MSTGHRKCCRAKVHTFISVFSWPWNRRFLQSLSFCNWTCTPLPILSLFLEKHRGTWGTLFHTSPEFQSLSVAFLIHNHRMSPFPGASNSFSPGATSASWLPSKVCLSPPCSQPPDSHVTVTHAGAVLVEGSSAAGLFPLVAGDKVRVCTCLFLCELWLRSRGDSDGMT